MQKLLLIVSAATAAHGLHASVSRAEVLRTALLLAPTLQPRVSHAGAPPLADRLNALTLKSPAVAPVPAEPALPSWVAGRWACTQTLESFRTPLGVQFIGAAGRPIAEAEASASETRRQLGQPIQLELRFEEIGDGGGGGGGDGGGGAREDRAFNGVSRLNAFAGRRVARSAAPCERAGGLGAVACTQVESEKSSPPRPPI